jgi:hypothetical protein
MKRRFFAISHRSVRDGEKLPCKAVDRILRTDIDIHSLRELVTRFPHCSHQLRKIFFGNRNYVAMHGMRTRLIDRLDGFP